MGIARLEELAGGGSRLLDSQLGGLADELGDEEAEREEHDLELTAEDDVGDETAEADEDRNERDPCEEVAEPIAPVVPDMRQCDGFEVRWWHCFDWIGFEAEAVRARVNERGRW